METPDPWSSHATSPISPPPHPGKHSFALCLNLPILDISCKRNHKNITGLSVSVFFDLAESFRGHLCQHATELHSFLWLNNIPLDEWTMFCLFVHQMVDIWVVSTFWLLWTMLLWTFMFRLSPYTFQSFTKIHTMAPHAIKRYTLVFFH